MHYLSAVHGGGAPQNSDKDLVIRLNLILVACLVSASSAAWYGRLAAVWPSPSAVFLDLLRNSQSHATLRFVALCRGVRHGPPVTDLASVTQTVPLLALRRRFWLWNSRSLVAVKEVLMPVWYSVTDTTADSHSHLSSSLLSSSSSSTSLILSPCKDLRVRFTRDDFAALITPRAREFWMCWRWFGWVFCRL